MSNAFLHGILTDEVYMEHPQGFINAQHLNYVCRLHKSIYGLKQASHAWFNRLSSFLIELLFVESQVDYSLFTYHDTNVILIVLIYVDDIILTRNKIEVMTTLIARLSADFAIKDLGPLSYFLGLEAYQDSSKLSLCNLNIKLI